MTGDVVVDDRLVTPYRVPNRNLLIGPMMVNENTVGVTVGPTRAARAAQVSSQPISRTDRRSRR